MNSIIKRSSIKQSLSAPLQAVEFRNDTPASTKSWNQPGLPSLTELIQQEKHRGSSREDNNNHRKKDKEVEQEKEADREYAPPPLKIKIQKRRTAGG